MRRTNGNIFELTFPEPVMFPEPGVDTFDLAFVPAGPDEMLVKSVQANGDEYPYTILTDNLEISSDAGETVLVPGGTIDVTLSALETSVTWLGSLTFKPTNIKYVEIVSLPENEFIHVSNYLARAQVFKAWLA